LKLTVSPAALADLERLRAFLADKNLNAARRAVSAITRAIDSLLVFPDRGHPAGSGGMRDLVVPFGRSVYIVRFAHDAQRDEIVIIRIWHGREQQA
jgi:plasmid stabilization system protein ParE